MGGNGSLMRYKTCINVHGAIVSLGITQLSRGGKKVIRCRSKGRILMVSALKRSVRVCMCTHRQKLEHETETWAC